MRISRLRELGVLVAIAALTIGGGRPPIFSRAHARDRLGAGSLRAGLARTPAAGPRFQLSALAYLALRSATRLWSRVAAALSWLAAPGDGLADARRLVGRCSARLVRACVRGATCSEVCSGCWRPSSTCWRRLRSVSFHARVRLNLHRWESLRQPCSLAQRGLGFLRPSGGRPLGPAEVAGVWIGTRRGTTPVARIGLCCWRDGRSRLGPLVRGSRLLSSAALSRADAVACPGIHRRPVLVSVPLLAGGATDLVRATSGRPTPRVSRSGRPAAYGASGGLRSGRTSHAALGDVARARERGLSGAPLKRLARARMGHGRSMLGVMSAALRRSVGGHVWHRARPRPY